MTAHTCTTLTDGCYRCELNKDEAACWCCEGPYVDRGGDDPWEGRLDGYCEDCALTRCDAYPGDCTNRRTQNGRSTEP